MAWRRPGDKLLSEPRMESLLTHTCVTRPQWVNYNVFSLLVYGLDGQEQSYTSGPVFCLLLRVSSDYTKPITGQVTEVTCPVIGRAQPQLTPSKRQKKGPEQDPNVSADGLASCLWNVLGQWTQTDSLSIEQVSCFPSCNRKLYWDQGIV